VAGDDSTVLANGACEGLILAAGSTSHEQIHVSEAARGLELDLEGSASSLLSFVRQVLTLA
jgi:hypothetical protein